MPDLMTPMLGRLLDYCEARLEAAGRPVVTSALVVGDTVVWDDCCTDAGGSNGQLRLRVVQTDLTMNFPAASTTYTRCWEESVINIELSILRCAAGLREDGSSPSTAALLADAIEAHEDRQEILTALMCDFRADGTPDEDRAITRVSWQPLGPQGYCGGGMVTASLALDECQCP